jgi:redox-sensing transcriptional repressor
VEDKAMRIPQTVVDRLPLYLRHLEFLQKQQIHKISSQALGEYLAVNPAQIRKDLTWFGEFGRKGIGYEVDYLIERITHILNLDQKINVALIGAGRLGIALCHYHQARGTNINISHVFDSDETKMGLEIGPVKVSSTAGMQNAIKQYDIRIAIIAVPAFAAQTVTDELVDAGISSILNFAPTALRVPSHVHVKSADFTSELQSLAYYAFD